MILDDFVMLGKTVPEVDKKGRILVCAAGYSLELRQAIRIYPLARKRMPARWSLSRIPLERNPDDSRLESWKIRGDRSPGKHEEINRQIEPVRETVSQSERRKAVGSMMVQALKEANERRMSLCVIHPVAEPVLAFEASDTAQMVPVPSMFDVEPGSWNDARPARARFEFHPRLRFSDYLGDHDLMLRDWGCYEFLRKNPDADRWLLKSNLKLPSLPPLLCGNMNNARNAWLVISVFSCNVLPFRAADSQMSLLG